MAIIGLLADAHPHRAAEIYETVKRVRPETSYGTVSSWLQRQADDPAGKVSRLEGQRGMFCSRDFIIAA